MKKLVSLLLLVAMLVLSITAYAETDFASMSDQELEELIQQAQAELNSRKAAQGAAALETDGPVSILEAGWGINNNYLYYAFVARSNFDKAIRFPEFRVVIRDSEGDLISSDNYTTWYIMPGETIYCTDMGSKIEGETPASIEVEFLEPDSDWNYEDPAKMKLANASNPVVETAKLKKDSYFSRIVGEISNPNDEKIDSARVTVLFRDEEGKLLAGASTTVESIKPGKTTAFEISVQSDLVTDNYDVFATIDRN